VVSGQWSVVSGQPSYDLQEFDPGLEEWCLEEKRGKILATQELTTIPEMVKGCTGH
jgi:hypothetical protein